ncbi:MAG: hypothetical protein J5977_04505 [Fibrobacter sp.]|nr:hypothetical protein [Fibrobacter sp.]
MKFTMFFFSLSSFILLAACSQVASGSSENDDPVAESSSSKKETSSSSKGNNAASNDNEISEEKCTGDSGTPWDGTTAKDFACGAGTKLSPYVILTAEQLTKLSFVIGANEKDYQGKYYKLGADIILNDGKIIDEKGALVADSTKLHKWTPIGNSSVAFTGTFDGDGHTVSGMFINTTSSHNGLFGNSSGTIENLTVADSWVSGGKYTAGVVGYNVGTIENALNTASITAPDNCVGGVVGSSAQRQYKYNSILNKVVNKGIIVGKNNVGGVAGCVTNVTVDGAENSAPIEGFGYIGGVFGGIGAANNNDIHNLKNFGVVIGTHFVGGISGHCGGTSLTTSSLYGGPSYHCSDSKSWTCGSLTRAHNEANVLGKNYVGGVLGIGCGGKENYLSNTADIEGVYGTAGVIGSASFVTSSHLYNTGNIYGGNYVGGILSYNKEGVTNSAYSTGKVDGDSLVGLMIGYNYNTTMADYYYLEQGDHEPFGLNNGGGVATPKSEKEMKSSDFAELLGEDFVYDSGLNNGYPILKWEKEE